MGAIPPELSLDFKPTFIPKTITDLLREVSIIGNLSQRVSKLDGFIKGLEEEMRKIDAFKRELPLCMLLLNDAIAALREESRQCVARNVQPVLEEFIPLKNDHSDKDDGDSISIKKDTDTNHTTKEKKNWMSSVQLWNTDESHRPTDRKLETRRNDEAAMLGCKSKGEMGAFMPFKPYSGFASRKESKVELQSQGLSLLTPGIKNSKEDSDSTGSRNSCSIGVSSAPTAQSSFRSGIQSVQQQAARKQRRCWSPELHRRFVNALQQLGGSQVATPKQIRELMQVGGLTNDEVKSHLQKYRLHTRRVPSTTSNPANQSLVVLGSSMWMSQEQFSDSLKASNSQSGSPQGPLQLTTNTGGTSTTATGGDSMEDDEDTKSDNYSWKSHVSRAGKEDVSRAHPL